MHRGSFTISLITYVFNEVYLKREIFLVWLVLIKVGAAKRGQERRRRLRNARKVEGGEDLGLRDSAGT